MGEPVEAALTQSGWVLCHLLELLDEGDLQRSCGLTLHGSGDVETGVIENDPDAAVDHDERLDVTGVASGRYDAKIVYASGKACMARGVEVKEGKVFSLDDHDLTDCK